MLSLRCWENKVFIASTYGNLVSFNANTGFPDWDRPIPNVAHLISAFDNRLYVKTLSGALGVIDVTAGKVIGIYHQVRPERLLVNKLSDRLYLVSGRGEVQCLRPLGADLPTFTEQPDIVDEATEETKTAPAIPGSPFERGAAALDEGDDADPFGGDDSAADPFGAGDDDPFGAGDDDPFAP